MGYFAVLDLETDRWVLQKHIQLKKRFIKLNVKFGIIGIFNDMAEKVEQFVIHSEIDAIKCLLLCRDKYCVKINKKTYQKALKVFIHNLDFDFSFLHSLFLKLGYGREQIKPIATLEIKIIENGHVILDFCNSLPLFYFLSVKKLGKIVGLEKLEQDYDEKENEQFLLYCARDCEIVALALLKLKHFFNELLEVDYYEQITDLPISCPSFCQKLFLKYNTEEKLYMDKDGNQQKTSIWYIKDKENELLRKSFFGGKVECFDFNLHERVIAFDYNSFYPSIMILNAFPVPPYKYHLGKSIERTEFTCLIFANVYENTKFPIIPARLEKKKSIFAIGWKKGVFLQLEEEKWIIENGGIVNELWHIDCSQWKKCFTYLEKMYHYRLLLKKLEDNLKNGLKLSVSEINEIEKYFGSIVNAQKEIGLIEFYKLPLNASFGRFGMRTFRIDSQIYSWEQIIEKFGSIVNAIKELQKKGGHLVENFDESFSITKNIHLFAQTNVMIALRVTALCRLRLTNDMVKLDENGIRVIYIDSDSLWLDERFEEKAIQFLQIDEFALGYMKIDHRGSNFRCLGLKDYQYFDDKLKINIVKAKGISKPTSIYDVYTKSQDVCRPAKIAETIKAREICGSSIWVTKNKNQYYDKRIINLDLTTQPILVTQIENLDQIQNRNKQMIVVKILKKQLKK
jgi:hypothetical protein